MRAMSYRSLLPVAKLYTRQLRLRALAARASQPIACFHRTSCNLEGSPTGGTSSAQPSPTSSHRKDDNHQKQRRWQTSWRIPALTVSALGLPLGWYWNEHRQRGSAVADPSQFVKYTLVSREEVSSTCSIFSLKPASTTTIAETVPGSEWALTSVEFKQPQLQIVRSYTCLPPAIGQDPQELRFLIRKERGGEVSNFLHRLPVGAQLEIRGPHLEYAMPPNVKSAIFLAGGTGIAPALQAADILDGEADMHILWAVRRREDSVGGLNDTLAKASFWNWWSRPQDTTPSTGPQSHLQVAEKGAIVAYLEMLKRSFKSSPHAERRLAVDYFVDEEGTRIERGHLRNIIADQERASTDSSDLRRIIFVSGPAGFIDFWAGPKQWTGGRELQGPLGGVLSSLDLKGWEVVKL